MNKRIPIFLGFILVALALWIQTTHLPAAAHWLNYFENAAYDFQLRTKLITHPLSSTTLNTSIVIVDIDDKSLKTEGRWPWSRTKLAALLTQLQQNGAVVVAFDMLFPEEEANMASIVLNEINKQRLATQPIDPLLKEIAPFFDADKKFADALKQSDAILAITFIPDDYGQGSIGNPLLTLSTTTEKKLSFYLFKGFIGDIPILQQAAKSTGFINVFADSDGIIRRVPLLIRYQNNLYPSLALEAARLYLLTDVKLMTATYGDAQRLEGIKIGNHTIPTDIYSQVVIPFQGRSFTFPYFSASDVLNKKTPADAFSGKIVFVGTTAIGLSDLKATSAQNIFPGVEIQATIADGILKNNFSYRPNWSLGAELFLTGFFGILFALIFPYLGPRILLLLVVLIPTLLVPANNWLWAKTGIILSILLPLLLVAAIAILNIVYSYYFEVRRRERLKEMFGQYVPEKHIDEMLQSKGNYGLYGEDREMTVLFADIRGFTSISEKLSANQLKELLNEIFTPMTEIIFNHRGTIDKYIGDLIMSFWGAPLKDKHHAKNGIATALDMQKKLTELNVVLTAKDLPFIAMGIGINSGMMSVGDMGSKFRRNYTVLGDAVNLGSRVEGLTSYYGVKIIVTENTEKHQKHFLFRQLDKVRVKGKNEGVAIYEVLCPLAEATENLKNEINLSETALSEYYQQKWSTARDLFTQLANANPDGKFYRLYLERITEFEKTPPPYDWDGVYTHTSKK